MTPEQKTAWVELDDDIGPADKHNVIAVHLSAETAQNRNVVEVPIIRVEPWFPGCCGLKPTQ